jgi:ABC-2 type transport system permease protein
MCTMPPRDRPAGHRYAALRTQLVDLILIELTNWRWSWRSMLITGTLAPLISMLALGVFARDAGRDSLGYVLTGNMVISLMFGNMGNVQSHFVFMRFQGTLDYFATLPIRKCALVLAVVLSFLLLSLPSLVITALGGAWMLHIPVVIHPILFVVVPLCAISLSGVGALIGTRARTRQEGDALGLILTLGMAALGPVVVPPNRLPRMMVMLGKLSPATYAASALRQALLGPITWQLAADLAILTGITLLVYGWVVRSLDWRQR